MFVFENKIAVVWCSSKTMDNLQGLNIFICLNPVNLFGGAVYNSKIWGETVCLDIIFLKNL